MAPNKDMRRADLIVPYQEPDSSSDKPEFSSTISSTLPMAAMFTRNKYIGWAAVVFTVQNWLGESQDANKSSSTPGIFSVLMSGVGGASGTQPPAPVPSP
ncbi:hypothetical protein E4U21_006834 [Claviceps maximensis]|nr:hypothetical protein E4U21_006834 [Claviceps maximensis]